MLILFNMILFLLKRKTVKLITVLYILSSECSPQTALKNVPSRILNNTTNLFSCKRTGRSLVWSDEILQRGWVLGVRRENESSYG